MKVIDGTDLVLGRMSTHIAKSLLNGEEIHIINAEKAVIIGDKHLLLEKYRARRRAQNKGTPEHSPKWPRVPHLLVRKTVRGMLPWKTTKGRAAFKKLRVYSGNPKNLENAVKVDYAVVDARKNFITVQSLCEMLGYSG